MSVTNYMISYGRLSVLRWSIYSVTSTTPSTVVLCVFNLTCEANITQISAKILSVKRDWVLWSRSHPNYWRRDWFGDTHNANPIGKPNWIRRARIIVEKHFVLLAWPKRVEVNRLLDWVRIVPDDDSLYVE